MVDPRSTTPAGGGQLPRLSLAVIGTVMCAALGAFVAVCLWQMPVPRHTHDMAGFPDDSFIFFRYAENLANGHGIVWQPGEGPVEGVSSLAWTILLALGHLATGWSFPRLALNLGVACGALSLLIAWRAAHAVLPREHQGWALLAPLFLACDPVLARHAVSGMETTFAALFVTTMVWLVARVATPTPGRTALVGGFCGLAFLVRPDATIFAGVVPFVAYALIGVSADQPIAGMRRNAARLLGFVAAFAIVHTAVFCARWAYFETFLPLPAYIKFRPEVGLGSLTWLKVNLAGIMGFWSYIAVLVFPFVLSLALRRPLRPIEIGVGAGVLAFCAYMPLATPVLDYAHRFYVPMFGAIAIVAATAIVGVATAMDRLHATAITVTMAIVIAVHHVGQLPSVSVAVRSTYAWPWVARVGQALSTIGPITIAYSEAGAIPFFSRQRFIDYVGLNEKAIAMARREGRAQRDLWPYIERRYGLPDLYLAPFPGYEYADIRHVPHVLARYDRIPDLCGIGTYVLRDSPRARAIRDALSGINCR
jgi:arabinofuranosyltransferase